MGRFYFRISVIFLNVTVCMSHSIPVFAADSNKNFSIHQEQTLYSRETLEKMIIKEAKSAGLNPLFVLTIARNESGLNHLAKSDKGAIGIMQLMPKTAEELGVRDPYNPRQNISGGVRYLKQLQNEFKHPLLVAAAYHSGPQAVRNAKGIPKGSNTAIYIVKLLNDFYQIYDAGRTVSQAGSEKSKDRADLNWEGKFVLNLN